MSRGLLTGLAVAVAVSSCGGHRGELVVSAAASLIDVFGEIEAEFERTHPDVDVVFNFGGTSALREQVRAGAPADVFASASQSIADEMEVDGLLVDARPFAANRLVIAVPTGNPAGVRSLRDLGRDELLIGLCAPPVPCGALANETLAAAGVVVRPDTEEPDVRALATKVSLGELDAGLVYATDAIAIDGIEVIAIDGPTTRYVIARVAASDSSDAASEFIDFVLSADGRSLLRAAGFAAP